MLKPISDISPFVSDQIRGAPLAQYIAVSIHRPGPYPHADIALHLAVERTRAYQQHYTGYFPATADSGSLTTLRLGVLPNNT